MLLTRLVTLPVLLFTIVAAPAADLPIRQVVLYKHGVGFFERSGVIPAGEAARLDFRAEEMNDVLKSLMINGKSERISGLRYDSSIPLDQKLAAFPFGIGASQPLSGVLDQLKGSQVQMQIGSEKVVGAIVAARVVAGDKDRAERQQIILLVDSGDMRTFDLDAASSIKFTEAKLQTQFREYLEALTAARSKDKRSVYIDGASAGGRDITAEYIIPTPIWKSSYRLLFPESGDPVLEGWAVVDNTTGEDWTNVQMALVSGKPISFITELYSPRYIQRLTAELPEEQAQKPVLYAGAIASTAQTVEVEGASTIGSGSGSGSLQQANNGAIVTTHGGRNLLSLEPSKRKFAQSSFGQAAAGFELADLFEYRIAAPVTIKKNESAMLPFLQDKIQARKIDVYSDSTATHPLNAAELINSTGKTLDGGPITVYDRGGYVGEALVETVKAKDKRLISYGVDLGTRITTAIDSEEHEEREFHLNRGDLQIRAATVRKTSYKIRNVDPQAKTLIVEHASQPGFNVLTPKPAEITAEARRFELKLEGASSQSLAVVEERVDNEYQSLANLTSDVLLAYTKNKNLSEAGRRAMSQVADLKRQIATNSLDSNLTGTRVTGVTQDEERVRQNLQSVNGISGQQELVQKYAAQLAQLEQSISALRDRQSDLAVKNTALQTELDRQIEKLAF